MALRPSRSSVNLWLGRAGGVAPCHYDGYHNAFAQLHGRKRLLVATPNPNPNPNPSPHRHRHPDPNPHPNPKQVAPPAASALLRPFPFLHPSHAQEP